MHARASTGLRITGHRANDVGGFSRSRCRSRSLSRSLRPSPSIGAVKLSFRVARFQFAAAPPPLDALPLLLLGGIAGESATLPPPAPPYDGEKPYPADAENGLYPCACLCPCPCSGADADAGSEAGGWGIG